MFQEYENLSEEELDKKMEAVMTKIMNAQRMGMDNAVQQLLVIREHLQLELSERLEKLRFNDINSRVPKSLVIGEDNGKDEPDDG